MLGLEPIYSDNRLSAYAVAGRDVLLVFRTASNVVVTGLPTQIPYSTKQGIIFAEQEILGGEQGILSAEMKLSLDEISGTKSLG